MSDYLDASGIHKSYRIGGSPIPVLRGVTLTAAKGEWLALLGASGSGKTTLLNIIGGIEKPDAGAVNLGGIEYSNLPDNKKVRFRGRKIGLVFQAYHLLPELSVLENVELAAMLNDTASSAARRAKAAALLERVGLGHRLKHRPYELSGGEQQRTAIARSLINEPEILLADEPTGNLDSNTGAEIIDIFRQLHDSESRTLIMVTHDQDIARYADRVVKLKDGVIAG